VSHDLALCRLVDDRSNQLCGGESLVGTRPVKISERKPAAIVTEVRDGGHGT
jgi:hypothetical protein